MNRSLSVSQSPEILLLINLFKSVPHVLDLKYCFKLFLRCRKSILRSQNLSFLFNLSLQHPHGYLTSMAVANLTYRAQIQILDLMGTDAHPLLFLLLFLFLDTLGNLSMAVLVRSNGALWSSHVLLPGSPESCRCLLYTVTVHWLLSTLLHPVQTMSFQACLAQMYFFAALGITESYLLAVISFDCAVAKGDPFTTVFSWCPGTALCWWLSLGLCPPALAFAHTAHLRTLLAPLRPSAPLLL